MFKLRKPTAFLYTREHQYEGAIRILLSSKTETDQHLSSFIYFGYVFGGTNGLSQSSSMSSGDRIISKHLSNIHVCTDSRPFEYYMWQIYQFSNTSKKEYSSTSMCSPIFLEVSNCLTLVIAEVIIAVTLVTTFKICLIYLRNRLEKLHKIRQPLPCIKHTKSFSFIDHFLAGCYGTFKFF